MTLSGNQISVDPPVSVFISYDTRTGADFAREAKALCEDAGIEAWMWEFDREPGAFLFEEIASQIDDCTVFFYICTALDDPQTSMGQKYERNLALRLNKQIRVFAANGKYVPLTLVMINYEDFSECERIVSELSKSPIVIEPVKFLEEVQSIDAEG